jgi:hypothetical protein
VDEAKNTVVETAQAIGNAVNTKIDW